MTLPVLQAAAAAATASRPAPSVAVAHPDDGKVGVGLENQAAACIGLQPLDKRFVMIDWYAERAKAAANDRARRDGKPIPYPPQTGPIFGSIGLCIIFLMLLGLYAMITGYGNKPSLPTIPPAVVEGEIVKYSPTLLEGTGKRITSASCPALLARVTASVLCTATVDDEVETDVRVEVSSITPSWTAFDIRLVS